MRGGHPWWGKPSPGDTPDAGWHLDGGSGPDVLWLRVECLASAEPSLAWEHLHPSPRRGMFGPRVTTSWHGGDEGAPGPSPHGC